MKMYSSQSYCNFPLKKISRAIWHTGGHILTISHGHKNVSILRFNENNWTDLILIEFEMFLLTIIIFYLFI